MVHDKQTIPGQVSSHWSIELADCKKKGVFIQREQEENMLMDTVCHWQDIGSIEAGGVWGKAGDRQAVDCKWLSGMARLVGQLEEWPNTMGGSSLNPGHPTYSATHCTEDDTRRS